MRLYKFLDAATKSLTTDPGLASLNSSAAWRKSLKGIGLDHIQFLTVPFEAYPPDPNRLQWAPGATKVWYNIRQRPPDQQGSRRRRHHRGDEERQAVDRHEEEERLGDPDLVRRRGEGRRERPVQLSDR